MIIVLNEHLFASVQCTLVNILKLAKLLMQNSWNTVDDFIERTR